MSLIAMMRNFTIRLRMWGAIATVILTLVTLGGAGIGGQIQARSVSESFITKEFASMTRLAELRNNIGLLRQHEKEMVAQFQNAAELGNAKADWQEVFEATAASTEQSDGISQVNVSVMQLDQMTQQNAALVSQGASAAESLKDQAERLTQLAGTFKLEGAHNAAPQTAVTPPARKAPAPTTRAVPTSSHAKTHSAHPASPVPTPAGATKAQDPAVDEWETF